MKELLVATIAGNHPPNPNAIEDHEFWACREFLGHFLASDKGGHVFTLNYDLLLYWALMHDDNPFDDYAVELRKNDSFGNDEDDPEADYVVWQGETAAHRANIHFLHGALHLFDSGSEIQKYTWVRKGEPLVEQARAAIAANKFPLFVAEGTSYKRKIKSAITPISTRALRYLHPMPRRAHIAFLSLVILSPRMMTIFSYAWGEGDSRRYMSGFMVILIHSKIRK